jgi:hypothetical protein
MAVTVAELCANWYYSMGYAFQVLKIMEDKVSSLLRLKVSHSHS